MKVVEYICKRLSVTPSELNEMLLLGPPKRRLCLDGELLSVQSEMPTDREEALFRVGKHLYIIRKDAMIKLSQGA